MSGSDLGIEPVLSTIGKGTLFQNKIWQPLYQSSLPIWDGYVYLVHIDKLTQNFIQLEVIEKTLLHMSQDRILDEMMIKYNK